MFYHISKLIASLAAPVNVATGVCLAGAVLLLTARRRFSCLLVATGAVALAVLGISPLSKIALRQLEDHIPPFLDDGRSIDGIIVLGGIGFARGQVTLYESGSRIVTATALALRHPEARIVFSGGAPGPAGHGAATEADAAASFFRGAGIPAERIVLEKESRNTHENARFTRRLVNPGPGERWILITSAFHMPRALATFRAAGLDPVPYSVDFRTRGDSSDWHLFSRVSDGLRLTDLAANEWLGLMVYRAAGFTSELLPDPNQYHTKR